MNVICSRLKGAVQAPKKHTEMVKGKLIWKAFKYRRTKRALEGVGPSQTFISVVVGRLLHSHPIRVVVHPMYIYSGYLHWWSTILINRVLVQKRGRPVVWFV